ncbi:PxKF domain-containing protein [Nocardioides KLBMP 9356]|uniref:PxKF domain-containing protein n=1 Tax=Nocardioides potassii TaxID=2911371 RepID=A0ABS9HEC4_9ACTN|nr:PxKF domain-containing protein [Nocardioides potassii]MCF6378413.1 PxKF domain-containing protein [Nocardioides potassii]
MRTTRRSTPPPPTRRRPLLALLCATAVLVALVAPGADAAPTTAGADCDVTWTGAGQYDEWSAAANWSTGVVPESLDRVCIDAGPGVTVTVHSGADEIIRAGAIVSTSPLFLYLEHRASFVVEGGVQAPDLTLVDGRLSLGGQSRFGRVEQVAGTLTGPGDIWVDGVYRWAAGDLTGTGRTYVGQPDDADPQRTALVSEARRGGAPYQRLDRQLLTQHLRATQDAEMVIDESGSLEVARTTELAGGGSIDGRGRLHLAGEVAVRADADWRVGPETVEVPATVAITPDSTESTPNTTDTLLVLGAETGTVRLTGPVRVGGGARLVLSGEVVQTGTATGAGATEYAGAATRASVGQAPSTAEVDVDRARVAFGTDLDTQSLEVTSDGVLSLGSHGVSATTVSLDGGRLDAARLAATTRVDLGTGGELRAPADTTDMLATPVLAVGGHGRLTRVDGEVDTLTVTASYGGQAGRLDVVQGGWLATDLVDLGGASLLSEPGSDSLLTTRRLVARGTSRLTTTTLVTEHLAVEGGGNLLAARTTVDGDGRIDGRLTLVGAFHVAGDVAVTAGQVVDVTRTGRLVLTGGTVGGDGAGVYVSGAVSGHGLLVGDVRNTGTVVLEDETLTVDGYYTQHPEGTLAIEDPASSSLTVTGPVELDGTLSVEDVDAVEDEATILTGSPVTGRFGALDGSAACGSDLTYTAGDVTLVRSSCLTAGDTAAYEGDTARVELRLDRPRATPVRIDWRAVGGSASADDWSGPGAGVVTIAAGELTTSIALPLRDDELVEGEERLDLVLSSPAVRTEEGDVEVRVLENHLDTDYRWVHMPRLGAGWRPTSLGTSLVAGTYTPTVGEDLAWVFRPSDGELADTRDGFMPVAMSSIDVAVGSCGGGGCVRDHGREILLSHPPLMVASPTAVSADGRVVGLVEHADGSRDLARWASYDAVPRLTPSTPDLTWTSDLHTNDEGLLAGVARRQGQPVLFSWGRSGWRELSPPAGWSGADVVGVSDAGVLAGTAMVDGLPHAWRWPGVGPLVDLGANTVALDTDATGQVAGALVEADGSMIARLWRGRWITLDSALHDLLVQQYGGTLHLNRTQLVNDQGTLVVEGWTPDGPRTGVLMKDGAGCRLCLGAQLQEAAWPDPTAFVRAGDTAVEGNPARVLTTLQNDDVEQHEGTVSVLDPSGDVVATHDVSLAPGRSVDLADAVSLDGLAWDRGAEAGPVDFTVTVEEDGGLWDQRTLTTTVLPRPVVMVHGMNSDASTWAPYPAMLEAAHDGWTSRAVDTMRTDPVGYRPIRANADELAAAVTQTQRKAGAFQVDLVAHSMGGLISRSYINGVMTPPSDATGSAPRAVRRLVMLGTPNGGSPCADLFRVPMTAELRTDAMWLFNQVVTARHGVPFSVGIGDVIPVTCGWPGGSDSVVSTWSARQGGMEDTQTFATWHTDMTASKAMFTQYVLPRLQGRRPVDAQHSALAAEPGTDEQPQLVARDDLVLEPGASASTQVPVPAAGRLLATALDTDPSPEAGDLEVRLQRDGGPASVSPDVHGPTPFVTAVADNPAAGRWTVTVVNHGARRRTVPLSTWVQQVPSRLEATAVQSGPEEVLVTARVTGIPVTPGEVQTWFTGRDGQVVPGTSLHDDGTDGDAVAGDGTWSGLTAGVASGPTVVDVRASGGGFSRLVSAFVDVTGVNDGPGDDAPIAFAGTQDVPGSTTTPLHMRAVDPEGAALAYDVVEQPQHGRLSGTAPFGYRPDEGFAGTDTVRWRVSDGHRWSETVTTTIRVVRASALLDLTSPTTLKGGAPQRITVRVLRQDASIVDSGTLEYRLGDQVRTTDLAEGNSVTFDVPVMDGRLPLTVTFSGTADLAPATLTAEMLVQTGTAPAPTVLDVRGEADYPLRVTVDHNDADLDVVRVDVDFQADGTWDASRQRVVDDHHWQPTRSSFVTTYPAAVTDGRLRARVTDAAGHSTVVSARVDVAPHRELGAMRRITLGGQPVVVAALGADGRTALVQTADDSDPDTDPALPGEQSAVLDLVTGEHEVVTVRPDGTPVGPTAYASTMSPNGRWVLFTELVWIGDKQWRQVFARDVQLDRTVLVSRGPSGPAVHGASPYDVTDDGRVLFSADDASLSDEPVTCPDDRGCTYLLEADLVSGENILLDVLPVTYQNVHAPWSSGGHTAAWASWDGRTVQVRRNGVLTTTTMPVGTRAEAVGWVDDDGSRFAVFQGRDARSDVLMVDAATGATTVLSTTADGGLTSTGAVGAFDLDACGRRTVWSSPRADLVPGDTNQSEDVFLHEDGRTRRVSIEPRDGLQTGGAQLTPSWHALSEDGRWLMLVSAANDLVPGDVTELDSFLLDLGSSTSCAAEPNQPPTVSVEAPAGADEGATVDLRAVVADPEDDDVTTTWHVDGGILAVSPDGLSARLTVGDGPATRRVTVSVDDGTTVVERIVEVAVRNVAPTLVVAPVADRTVGQELALTGQVSDVPEDTVRCTVDWKDGTQSTGTASAGTCTLRHAWTQPGSYVVEVAAVDDDGAVTTRAVTVRVTAPAPVSWPWDGFFQPVDNLPVVNTVKAGQAVPVKFSLGGDRGLDIFAAGFPQSGQTTCSGAGTYDAIESTDTPGAAVLTYEPTTQRYHYVWKTSKAWAGQCRTLVLRLKDGSEHRAEFRFR